MKITLYMDALSLWCLLAARSLEETLRELPDIQADFRIALLRDGAPLGYTQAEEAYFYRRMEALSGTHLNPGWLMGPETSTYYANAALQAVRILGVTDLALPLRMMEAAMVDGRETWRRDVAAEVAAEASGLSASDLLSRLDSDAVRSAMAETQREMLALGMDQRPTLVLENAIPDRAVLMGVWDKGALGALASAMLRDEQRFVAFNAANPFPG